MVLNFSAGIRWFIWAQNWSIRDRLASGNVFSCFVKILTLGNLNDNIYIFFNFIIKALYLLLFFNVFVHSKLQSEALREAILQIVTNSKEKKRNFIETIELQIGLKNYDPQKDKRFSGSVKLPHIPRPKMKICMLGDAQHVEEVNLYLVIWQQF